MDMAEQAIDCDGFRRSRLSGKPLLSPQSIQGLKWEGRPKAVRAAASKVRSREILVLAPQQVFDHPFVYFLSHSSWPKFRRRVRRATVAIVHTQYTDCLSGQKGAAKNYITRTQAVRKLQISLPDFRRLCIFKGTPSPITSTISAV